MPSVIKVTDAPYSADKRGQFDATAAIQAAIDAIDPYGTVIIPRGIYMTSRNQDFHLYIAAEPHSWFAFRIKKPCTILMEQKAIIHIEAGNADTAYGAFWADNTTEVNIIGGVIKGTSFPADGTLTSRIGVFLDHSTKCNVQDVYLKNLTQGVNIWKSSGTLVEKVTAEFIKRSGIISNLSRDNTIRKCFVRNTGDGHISLYGVGVGGNNVVDDCDVIEDRPGVLSEQGITVEGEQGSTVKNCRVRGFFYSIDVKNGSRDCIIQDNHIEDHLYGVSIRKGDDGQPQSASSNITIERNQALSPRKNDTGAEIWPNRTIWVENLTGSGHIVKENTAKYGRIIKGATPIGADTTFADVEFVGNIYY